MTTKITLSDYNTVMQTFVENLNEGLGKDLIIPYTVESLKNSNIGVVIDTSIKSILLNENNLMQIYSDAIKTLKESQETLTFQGGASFKGLIAGLLNLKSKEGKSLVSNATVVTTQMNSTSVHEGQIAVFVKKDDGFDKEVVLDYLYQNVAVGIQTVRFNNDAYEARTYHGGYLVKPVTFIFNYFGETDLNIEFIAEIPKGYYDKEEIIPKVKEAIIKSFNENFKENMLTIPTFTRGEVFADLSNIDILCTVECDKPNTERKSCKKLIYTPIDYLVTLRTVVVTINEI